MLIPLFKNSHQAHRKALLEAVAAVNESRSQQKNIYLIVGNKNVIRYFFWLLCFRPASIIYYTSLGRLMTDYGLCGRLAFCVSVIMLDRLGKIKGFIVENSDDAAYLTKFVRKASISLINGSGFTGKKIKPKTNQADKNKQTFKLGYLARFGNIKCTDVILEIAQKLPSHYELFIAGGDIVKLLRNKNHYTQKFTRLAQQNKQIHFLGYLQGQDSVSDFFAEIDILLYPSKREGLPITLLESIWHDVPFVTTQAPGCWQVAQAFGCTALPISDFADYVLSANFQQQRYPISQWEKKRMQFSQERIAQDFHALLIKICDA